MRTSKSQSQLERGFYQSHVLLVWFSLLHLVRVHRDLKESPDESNQLVFFSFTGNISTNLSMPCAQCKVFHDGHLPICFNGAPTSVGGWSSTFSEQKEADKLRYHITHRPEPQFFLKLFRAQVRRRISCLNGRVTTDETVKILICIFKCQSRAKLCATDVTLTKLGELIIKLFKSAQTFQPQLHSPTGHLLVSTSLYADDNLFLYLPLSISYKTSVHSTMVQWFRQNCYFTARSTARTTLVSAPPLGATHCCTKAFQFHHLLTISYFFYIFFVSSYLFCRHSFNFFLHLKNLPGFKAQGCKHKQEQHQHYYGQTRFDSHEAPALPTTLDRLSCRWERPAGNQIRRLGGAVWTSTFVYEKHLWERISLLAAHDASPSDTSRQRICLRCTEKVWTY